MLEVTCCNPGKGRALRTRGALRSRLSERNFGQACVWELPCLRQWVPTVMRSPHVDHNGTS
jgi:hypothetical protein